MLILMQGVGFEPTKALPPELKSGPFGRSGTPAGCMSRTQVLNATTTSVTIHRRHR